MTATCPRCDLDGGPAVGICLDCAALARVSPKAAHDPDAPPASAVALTLAAVLDAAAIADRWAREHDETARTAPTVTQRVHAHRHAANLRTAAANLRDEADRRRGSP